MRSTSALLCLGLLAGPLSLAEPAGAATRAAPAAPVSKAASLRELSGSVGVVDRGAAPLGAYLDKLDAALWLERGRGTAGPYVVSIANSLEALDPKERDAPGTDGRGAAPDAEGRGAALLREAYLLLAQFSGPKGPALMSLYAAGLGQLVGAKADEVAVTDAMRADLRQIGAYAAAAAARLIERLPPAPRAEARTALALAQGRYGEAAQQARAWDKAAPSPLSRAHLLGAQLLAGQGAAAAQLRELERQGGPAGHMAWQLLRRAAREALVARLGKALAAPSLPAEVRQSAVPQDEPAVREACQVLIKVGLPAGAATASGDKGGAAAKDPAEASAGAAAPVADKASVGAATPGADKAAAGAKDAAGAKALPDCLVLALESPSSEWAQHPALGAGAAPRLRLLRLAAQLGALLGLPGRGPAREAAERERALAEVRALLPAANLPPEEAEALTLLAQIAAAQRPEVPAPLQGAVDAFVKERGCTPLSLPLQIARHAPPQRAAALGESLGRCDKEGGPRQAEALRQLAAQVLALSPAGPGADAAAAALERLAGGHRGAGEGRFLLAAADGAALRLFGRRGPPADKADEALEAAQRRYAQAAAALSPLDGPEARGRAEVQQASLLLRRHQLKPRPELLEEARAHLRFALLLPPGDEGLVAQAVEEAVTLEALRQDKKPITAPTADLSKLPRTAGRRVLACQLAERARAAKDGASAGRYAALAGPDPIPDVASTGQVRLTTSVGVDERLRVGTRGEVSVLVPPRCGPR